MHLKRREVGRGTGLLALTALAALALAGESQASSGQFDRAWGKDVDAVTATTGFEICTVAASCQSGSAGGAAGELSAPEGVATDAAGNVYVADLSNNRVEKFDSSGNFLRTWGKDVDSAAGTGFEICTVAANCQPAKARRSRLPSRSLYGSRRERLRRHSPHQSSRTRLGRASMPTRPVSKVHRRADHGGGLDHILPPVTARATGRWHRRSLDCDSGRVGEDGDHRGPDHGRPTRSRMLDLPRVSASASRTVEHARSSPRRPPPSMPTHCWKPPEIYGARTSAGCSCSCRHVRDRTRRLSARCETAG